MSFQPWIMFAADREFHIKRSDMMITPKEVDEMIEVEYKKYFMKDMDFADDKEDGSIIITPPSKSGEIILP